MYKELASVLEDRKRNGKTVKNFINLLAALPNLWSSLITAKYCETATVRRNVRSEMTIMFYHSVEGCFPPLVVVVLLTRFHLGATARPSGGVEGAP